MNQSGKQKGNFFTPTSTIVFCWTKGVSKFSLKNFKVRTTLTKGGLIKFNPLGYFSLGKGSCIVIFQKPEKVLFNVQTIFLLLRE